MIRTTTILGLMMFAAYLLVNSSGFVYEDHNVEASMDLTARYDTSHREWEGWETERTQIAFVPRALVNMTYRAQAWAGASARGFHVGNVLIHLLNGLLLVWLLRPFRSATLALALFWLHPINAEAVAYVAARTDLLCATGILIMLLGSERDDAWMFVLTTLGAAVAVWAKESGIVAVVLLPLWWHWRQRWPHGGVALLGAWVASALPMCYRLIHVSAQSGSAHPWQAITIYTSAAAHGFAGYAAVQSGALLRLLLLVVWPFGLSIDHDFDRMPMALAIAAVITVAAWGCWACSDWVRRGWLSTPAFAVLWVLGSLSMRFIIPMPEYLHEQHLYVPLIGVWIGCAAGLANLVERLSVTRVRGIYGESAATGR